MEILLGQKVRDKLTGIEGIVEHIAIYPFGCRRIAIQQPVDKKTGTVPEMRCADEPQLEIIEKKQLIKVEVPPMKFAFGQTVEEQYSGLKGKITGRAIYLNGCARVEVTGEFNYKTDQVPSLWVNEGAVKATGKILPVNEKKQEEKTKKSPGGPCNGGSIRRNSI